jgi:hypothetical protein
VRRQSNTDTKAPGSRSSRRRGSSVLPSVTLEVMNPRGAIAPPAVVALTERVTDLSGKRIGIYWNGKKGADNLLDVMGELLEKRFPSSTILRYDGPLDVGDTMANAIAQSADTFIYGVGD